MEHGIIPTEVLLGAYAQGVFPMAEDGEILWLHAENEQHVNRSDRQELYALECDRPPRDSWAEVLLVLPLRLREGGMG